MRAKDYKFCDKIGPGGMKCPCCADKGSKRRANRKFRRTHRTTIRNERQEAKQ